MAILEVLKLKVASSPSTSLLVTLAIDEMSIKEGVTHDAARDIIEGFTDTGVTRTDTLANLTNVFLVRGVVNKWKQPVAYYLSSGPMSGTLMTQLLFQCIRELRQIGLRVVVVVCDQGTNNRNMVQTNLGVTSDRPFFMCDDEKIFMMYDPPHLVKSIRNNLKKNGFTIDNKDICWEHVRLFFEKDSSKPIRLAPKLTQKHIEIPPFAHLRVYLATQVLSHSVAAGMSAMAQWEVIPGET